MPAYNFQKQFVPLILDGSKTTTIRAKRKHPTEAGDQLIAFIGLRTKNCKKIATAWIVDVSPILIYPFESKTIFNGVLIPEPLDRRNAQKDGFTSLEEYYDFFKRYKLEELNFEVITWDYDSLVSYVIRSEWKHES